MRTPPDALRLLIDGDAFRACPLLPTSDFVSHCRERGLAMDAARLRRFEQLGVFLPLLRVRRPEIVVKVERCGNGWRDLGPVGDGEDWRGDTHTELALFDQTQGVARSWREHGLLWDPGDRHAPDDDGADGEQDQQAAYYSRFQVHALARVVAEMTVHVGIEWAVEDDGSASPSWSLDGGRYADLARTRVEAFRAAEGMRTVGLLCQAVANRFYFQTQGDEFRITVTQRRGWVWEDYIRSWRADGVLQAFSLTADSLRSAYEALDFAWRSADPMSAWHKLTRFVSVDKRRLLMGDAQMGVALREMAHMLRLLHGAAFGPGLPPLGEVGVAVFACIPEVEPDDDPLRALELVANDFGVNPKPRLVLFVEGKTELEALPLILERCFGTTPAVLGIEISDLGGVESAAGGKEAPFSALWRLVDYLHHHQTHAFVLMDNEGYATRNIAGGLPNAVSVHSRERMATRADHVHVWELSFEYDNFSDREIACGLNQVTGADRFDEADVAASRASSAAAVQGGRVASLGSLYFGRTGCPLDKPRLGRLLVEAMLVTEEGLPPGERPVVMFLARVVETAALNHQPVTRGRWLANQRSGHLGTLRKRRGRPEAPGGN